MGSVERRVRRRSRRAATSSARATSRSPDGRLLVAGGHIEAYEGTKDTNIFNPQTDRGSAATDMAVARWYPTATALPDGRVFVVSGDNITLGTTPTRTRRCR